MKCIVFLILILLSGCAYEKHIITNVKTGDIYINAELKATP